jgi:hypothetical protein
MLFPIRKHYLEVKPRAESRDKAARERRRRPKIYERERFKRDWERKSPASSDADTQAAPEQATPEQAAPQQAAHEAAPAAKPVRTLSVMSREAGSERADTPVQRDLGGAAEQAGRGCYDC